MSRIEHYEDLPVWREAMDLTQHVYWHTRRWGGADSDAARERLRRPALGVLDAIRKGYESPGLHDFARELRRAQQSCSDLQARLIAAVDARMLDPEQGRALALRADALRHALADLSVPEPPTTATPAAADIPVQDWVPS